MRPGPDPSARSARRRQPPAAALRGRRAPSPSRSGGSSSPAATTARASSARSRCRSQPSSPGRASTLSWTGDLREGAIFLGAFMLPFGLLAVGFARLPWRGRWLTWLWVRSSARRSLYAIVGLYQWVTRDVFWNPGVIVGNAYAPFFRVNSVFWDPSIYGRYLTSAIFAALVGIVLGGVRLEPARGPLRRGRRDLARALPVVLPVELRRALRRGRRRGVRRVALAAGHRRGCSCSSSSRSATAAAAGLRARVGEQVRLGRQRDHKRQGKAGQPGSADRRRASGRQASG